MLNVIAIDIQLYKIFKITRLSFLAHSVASYNSSVNSQIKTFVID